MESEEHGLPFSITREKENGEHDGRKVEVD